MNVYLVDGTYELFRHFFAVPSHNNSDGEDVGAIIGVLGSILRLLEQGVSHIGIATDHTVESFRNELWPDYKTGAGIDPALLRQFIPLEYALQAMGIIVWPMIELEADDALASAAARAAKDPSVDRVVIATPDKDLGQCVGGKVLQLDRRNREFRNAAAIKERFGVPPISIPDYLALVGDGADGFPGLPGWGAKSSALILARYGHIEAIPDNPAAWDISVRGANKLAETLTEYRDQAFLFRDLATLRTTAEVFGSIEDLRWAGPRQEFTTLTEHLRTPQLLSRAEAAARQLGVLT